MTKLTRLIAGVLDPSWLSDQLGVEVRAARMRIKPETSVTISVVDALGRPTGWARWLWPISYGKAAKAQQLAAELGLSTVIAPGTEGLLLQHGPWPTDPKLAQALHTFGIPQDATLLRYNPLRRVVLRDGDSVVRIQARHHRLGLDFDRFLASQVPTPRRLDDGQHPGYSRQAVTGDGDLAARPDVAASRRAGELVARLHASVVPAELGAMLAERAMSPTHQGAIHAQLLDHLDPGLAAWLRRVVALLERAGSEPLVLSHGDLSPDQVLTSASGVWLTDFDRACLAPRWADLGSFLAVVDEETGGAFLDGYRVGAGRLPNPRKLRAATADSLVLRAADPLRLAEPDWADQIAATLQRIEKELS